MKNFNKGHYYGGVKGASTSFGLRANFFRHIKNADDIYRATQYYIRKFRVFRNTVVAKNRKGRIM